MPDPDSNVIGDDDFWSTMGANDVNVKKEVITSDVTPIVATEDKSLADTSPIFFTSVPFVPEEPVAMSMTVTPPSYKKYSINDLPTIKMESVLPTEYLETVERVLDIYKSMPKIDHNLIRRQAKDLMVQSYPTPDAQSINELLEKIQASKDRLSEILSDIIQSYNFKKRAVDVLRDMWPKYSGAKSADARKAEANNIVCNFELDLAHMESTFKVCDHILKHLDGLHDGVSRRITIMQVCLKYADIGRGMAPDFSFKTFSSKLNAEENQKKTFDPSEGIDAVEQGFQVK